MRGKQAPDGAFFMPGVGPRLVRLSQSTDKTAKTMMDDNPVQTSCAQTGPTPAPPRLTTLILLSALAVLPVNMILPSLPNIAATFQADFAIVNLSVAGYAIATALTEIIAGAISTGMGAGRSRWWQSPSSLSRPLAALWLPVLVFSSCFERCKRRLPPAFPSPWW
jgi:DHA1 family bicyclomycin/chloramphenicol resistance-like MFS transporter